MCVCVRLGLTLAWKPPRSLSWLRERSLLAYFVTPKAGTEQEGKAGSEEWNVTGGNANCPWQLVQKACSPWLNLDLWYFTKSNGTWQLPPQGEFWLGYLKRFGINTPTNTWCLAVTGWTHDMDLLGKLWHRYLFFFLKPGLPPSFLVHTPLTASFCEQRIGHLSSHGGTAQQAEQHASRHCHRES